jgi:hypothetical protein
MFGPESVFMIVPRLRDIRLGIFAPALLVLGAIACVVSAKEIRSTRHELVQSRLRTAVGITHDRAAAALTSPEARPAFFEEMRNWARVTGLRLTLVQPDGIVLADTEVAHMPNLADRPEVRAAQKGQSDAEFRRSVMTGKETLYVATPISKNGNIVGIVRASTSSEDIDEVLAGFEYMFMVIAGCCIGLGVLLGLVLGLTARRNQVDLEPVPVTPARADAAQAPAEPVPAAAPVADPEGLAGIEPRETKAPELTSIAD